MNANEKLVEYILNLTEEQVERLFTQLPQLISLLEEAKVMQTVHQYLLRGCY
ncbi:MAG: hypothetical protein IJZ16_01130 [Clostridia bacterium]|nr:hypothetical protein [Clostridia bacterium]